MSEHAGDKTEQATPRRLEEACKKGQIARSSEVQTVFVLMAGTLALMFTAAEIWRRFVTASVTTYSHLHEVPLSPDAMQGYAVHGALALAACVWPVLGATVVGGLLAGGLQNHFRTAPDALEAQWERLNPITGLKRVFSSLGANGWPF